MDFKIARLEGHEPFPVLSIDTPAEALAVDVATRIRLQQLRRGIPKLMAESRVSRWLLGQQRFDEAHHLAWLLGSEPGYPATNYSLSDEHAEATITAIHNLTTSEAARGLAQDRFGPYVANTALYDTVRKMDQQIWDVYKTQASVVPPTIHCPCQ